MFLQCPVIIIRLFCFSFDISECSWRGSTVASWFAASSLVSHAVIFGIKGKMSDTLSLESESVESVWLSIHLPLSRCCQTYPRIPRRLNCYLPFLVWGRIPHQKLRKLSSIVSCQQSASMLICHYHHNKNMFMVRLSRISIYGLLCGWT